MKNVRTRSPSHHQTRTQIFSGLILEDDQDISCNSTINIHCGHQSLVTAPNHPTYCWYDGWTNKTDQSLYGIRCEAVIMWQVHSILILYDNFFNHLVTTVKQEKYINLPFNSGNFWSSLFLEILNLDEFWRFSFFICGDPAYFIFDSWVGGGCVSTVCITFFLEANAWKDAK